MAVTSREVHLAKRPEGLPQLTDFRLVESQVPDLRDGQLLIKQLYMSVDPAMRPRLSVGYELDQVLTGGAIGRIDQSNNPAFAVGDVVHNQLGFREYAVCDGSGLRKVEPQADIPLSAYMSVMGVTGLTAYQGITDVAKVKEGEQVFVSAAAGAVGSIAAQIAKIKGCYVIGSAGADDKVAWLTGELGLDAAFNYKNGPVNKQLRAAAPKGLDAYFDNVGGEHLDAALAVMNVRGRVAACGMISGYHERGTRTTVHNLANIIYGRISILGFVVFDFMHRMDEFQAEMAGWIRDGRVKHRETIHQGIEEAPAAMSHHYDDELESLQLALVRWQQAAMASGEKVLIIFEGRDAAGKDGTIQRITEHLSVRNTRVVALPKPSDRERTQWYFQRFVAHLPAAGETVIFNRSWYNRAGVERVMDFCTSEDVACFFSDAPIFEAMLVRDGLSLVKIWLDVSKKEQAKRLAERKDDPLKVLKASPLDAYAQSKWDDYTAARDEMLSRTHTTDAPWVCVQSDDKKPARLAVMQHLVHRLASAKVRKGVKKPSPDILFPFETAAISDGRLRR